MPTVICGRILSWGQTETMSAVGTSDNAAAAGVTPFSRLVISCLLVAAVERGRVPVV